MITLHVEKRDLQTKAKRLRREGFVTGNLYGKAIDGSIPVKIEERAAEHLMRNCLKGSQLNLDVEGTTYDVLLKELNYDSMNHKILEMDFQALVKGEKVRCTTEVVLHNKDAVTEGVLEQLGEEVAYKALPEDILNKIDIDCSTLRVGDVIHVGDLPFSKNDKIDLITDPETIIVIVNQSKNKAAASDDEDATEE